MLSLQMVKTFLFLILISLNFSIFLSLFQVSIPPSVPGMVTQGTLLISISVFSISMMNIFMILII